MKAGTTPIFKKEQEKKEKQAAEEAIKREIFLDDIRITFGTPHGLRTLEWLLVDLCHHGSSIFETSAKIHRNSGAQDVGQLIVDAITVADIEIYFKFLRVRRDDFIARKINKKS